MKTRPPQKDLPLGHSNLRLAGQRLDIGRESDMPEVRPRRDLFYKFGLCLVFTQAPPIAAVGDVRILVLGGAGTS